MTRRSLAVRLMRSAITAVLMSGLAVAAARITVAADQPKPAPEPVPRATVTAAGDAVDYFGECTECHRDLDRSVKEKNSASLVYRHDKHFAKGVTDCESCHPATTHVRDITNKPTMLRCFMCHGVQADSRAPGKCSTCHTPGFNRPPQNHRTSVWRSKHGGESVADGLECRACHVQSQCTTCHGVAMPHAKSWKDLPHVTATFDKGIKLCGRCHARGTGAKTRDFCDKCHHPKGSQNASWITVHRTIVASDGSQKCFACHKPATCSTCHSSGREDFSQDRANFPKRA